MKGAYIVLVILAIALFAASLTLKITKQPKSERAKRGTKDLIIYVMKIVVPAVCVGAVLFYDFIRLEQLFVYIVPIYIGMLFVLFFFKIWVALDSLNREKGDHHPKYKGIAKRFALSFLENSLLIFFTPDLFTSKVVNDAFFPSKAEARAKARALKWDVTINLAVSLILCFIFGVAKFGKHMPNQTDSFYRAAFFIMSIRMLSRVSELIVSGLRDAVSDKRSSALNSKDRMMLPIFSMIEISFVGIFFYYITYFSTKSNKDAFLNAFKVFLLNLDDANFENIVIEVLVLLGLLFCLLSILVAHLKKPVAPILKVYSLKEGAMITSLTMDEGDFAKEFIIKVVKKDIQLDPDDTLLFIVEDGGLDYGYSKLKNPGVSYDKYVDESGNEELGDRDYFISKADTFILKFDSNLLTSKKLKIEE